MFRRAGELADRAGRIAHRRAGADIPQGVNGGCAGDAEDPVDLSGEHPAARRMAAASRADRRRRPGAKTSPGIVEKHPPEVSPSLVVVSLAAVRAGPGKQALAAYALVTSQGYVADILPIDGDTPGGRRLDGAKSSSPPGPRARGAPQIR